MMLRISVLLFAEAVLAGRKKVPVAEPEPESVVIPTLLAVAVCWILPFVIMSQLSNKAKRPDRERVVLVGKLRRL